MTEEEARQWTCETFGTAIVDGLDRFADALIAENMQQNLIAPSTIPTLWNRHIVDSLQLVAHAPADGTWLDIGTGGGFPGLVVAMARSEPMILVEPRRRRAEFLQCCADLLHLRHVTIRMDQVERIESSAAVISARAVASIGNLLHAAAHCATPATRWLLPRGAVDRDELAKTLDRSKWMFHVEHSLTSDTSSIVILDAR